MPHVAGHKGQESFARFNKDNDGFQHWKYPETVGNDTNMDDINFNSNQDSEYAKKRMNALASMTGEPFMMFEFMKVDNDDYGMNADANPIGNMVDKLQDKLMKFRGQAVGGDNIIEIGTTKTIQEGGQKVEVEVEQASLATKALAKSRAVMDGVREFAKKIGSLVNRKYVGSIAMYMPTDIAINDQMVYNEDSRKMGAFMQTLFSENYEDIFNPTTLTSTTAMTAAGFVVGKIPFLGKMLGGQFSALVGAGLAQVVGTEVQRGTGKIANPNELMAYSATTMRNFTFAWTILPDSLKESEQATGLIKMFRKSAHATKDNLMIITVPDHVIVSFHGAGAERTNMIQLPPCVIESVGVTYNPNTSSFFYENNAPVEIGLTITLKEMAPIYSADVEAGY